MRQPAFPSPLNLAVSRQTIFCMGLLTGLSTLPAAAQSPTKSVATRNAQGHNPSRKKFMQNQFDAVIIGAGVAGLAAARKLQSLGRSVVVVEASSRIGGRAFTDRTSFSVPTDLGCAWLHQADRNPLTPLARALNFSLLDHEQAAKHFMHQGVPASNAQRDALDKAYQQIERKMAALGPDDASMSSLLTDPSDWTEQMVIRTIAELDSGGDAENTSALGVYEQGSTSPNWLVQEGMGCIVESLSESVRIALNTRVSEIEQRSGGVKVVTSAGNITARHCVVTVSTGVLRSEAIRFKPGLENEALSALDALPMGHFNKVVMEFDAPLQGFAPGDWLSPSQNFQPEKALTFLVSPFGSNLVIALAGGAYGQQLSTMPATAAEDEAISQLKDCLGGLQGMKLVRSKTTDWSANPLFNGGYAYLRTGGGDARKALARAGTDRVHFAGEATAIDLAQTCGGAYLTGINTAERIDALLRIV